MSGGHEKPRALCWNHRVLGARKRLCCLEVRRRAGTEGRAGHRSCQARPGGCKQLCPPPPAHPLCHVLCPSAARVIRAPRLIRSDSRSTPRRANPRFSWPLTFSGAGGGILRKQNRALLRAGGRPSAGELGRPRASLCGPSRPPTPCHSH